MNKAEIIQELTAERDRLQQAIDALSDGAEEKPVRTTTARVPRQLRQPLRTIECGCGKTVKLMGLHVHRRVCDLAPEDLEAPRGKRESRTVSPKGATACKFGCGKEFTSPGWLERHEADCAHVIRPNGSAEVPRRASA